MDNVVTYVCAQFGDDRLWNEKALADSKYDNNNKYYKNNVGSHGDAFPGPKIDQYNQRRFHVANV